jgi:hypothetical protein
MVVSHGQVHLAGEPAQSDALLGLVSIVLAFLIPPVALIIAWSARKRAEAYGADNRLAYWGFWLSVFTTSVIVLVVGGTIVMSLIGIPMGAVQ